MTNHFCLKSEGGRRFLSVLTAGPPISVPVPRPPVQVEKEGPDIPSRRAQESLVLEFGGRLPAGQVNKSRWCAGCFSQRDVTSRAMGCLASLDEGK